eukprot:247199-Pyramimonas_sp.AAC.1
MLNVTPPRNKRAYHASAARATCMFILMHPAPASCTHIDSDRRAADEHGATGIGAPCAAGRTR